MGKPKHKYTKIERANVLAFLFANGYGVRRGAMQYITQKIGVDHKAIEYWFKNFDRLVSMELLKQSMFNLEQLLQTELEGVFESMNKKRDTASYQQLVISLGIITDKLIVLQGGVTGRTESVTKDWKVLVEAARQESLVDKSNDIVYLPDNTGVTIE